MKKLYKKPMVVIESFQLDAAFAASCSSQNYIPINYGENNCGFDQGEEHKYQFFNFKNCDFDLTGEGGDGNDTECYHGPIYFGDTFISS